MPTTEKLVPTIEALLTSRIATLEKRIAALENKLGQASGAEKISDLPKAQADEPEPDPAQDAGNGSDQEQVQRFAPPEQAMSSGGGGRFEIVSVDSRTFERDVNEHSCKFSWKIVVKNLTDSPLTLRAELEFVDMDSYLVEEDTADGFQLDPGETGKFRGYKWISTEAERQIMGVRAHLTEAGAKPEPDPEPGAELE